jgi:hypothetical protein
MPRARANFNKLQSCPVKSGNKALARQVECAVVKLGASSGHAINKRNIRMDGDWQNDLNLII